MARNFLLEPHKQYKTVKLDQIIEISRPILETIRATKGIEQDIAFKKI